MLERRMISGDFLGDVGDRRLWRPTGWWGAWRFPFEMKPTWTCISLLSVSCFLLDESTYSFSSSLDSIIRFGLPSMAIRTSTLNELLHFNETKQLS